MAKQGYFSGKTEYNKQQKSGASGGYGKRTSGSDTRGYSKRKESEARGAYGSRQGDERNSYGKPADGEHKPYYGNRQGNDRNSYGKPADGEHKPYYGNRQGNGRNSYGKPSDGEHKPYYGNRQSDERNSYGKPSDGEHKPYYGNRQGNDRNSYGKPADGEHKPYYGNRQGDGRNSYGKPSDGERKPYARPRDTGLQDSEQATEQQGGDDELPFLIIGRNAVREAVRSGRSIDRILVSAEPDGSLREIIGYAKDAKIPVRETARKALDELCMPFGHGGKTANHQGIVAYAAGVEYCDVSDILALAKQRNEPPFVVVLDGIMDPHNLGSIIRSAECAGAHGVIIGKRRSASVTAATVKASAGAVEHVRIARVTNIPVAIKELKKAHVWIAGADMAGQPMGKQALDGAIALVIGNEGTGLSKLVAETCDFLVSIPLFGKIDSLNASVAAGVLLYEKKRQDAAKSADA